MITGTPLGNAAAGIIALSISLFSMQAIIHCLALSYASNQMPPSSSCFIRDSVCRTQSSPVAPFDRSQPTN
jgi:hypothetical protein